jgi:hypothetical protein
MALDGGESSASSSGDFTPTKEPLVVVKWASELVRAFLERRKIINGCDGILQLRSTTIPHVITAVKLQNDCPGSYKIKIMKRQLL